MYKVQWGLTAFKMMVYKLEAISSVLKWVFAIAPHKCRYLFMRALCTNKDMFAQYQTCNKSSQKYQKLFWSPEMKLYFFILPRKEYSEWKVQIIHKANLFRCMTWENFNKECWDYLKKRLTRKEKVLLRIIIGNSSVWSFIEGNVGQ